tara:strand:- start:389 stop:649 length:261 start_codon:yes stop_codon:yes gene_type:complete
MAGLLPSMNALPVSGNAKTKRPHKSAVSDASLTCLVAQINSAKMANALSPSVSLGRSAVMKRDDGNAAKIEGDGLRLHPVTIINAV